MNNITSSVEDLHKFLLTLDSGAKRVGSKSVKICGKLVRLNSQNIAILENGSALVYLQGRADLLEKMIKAAIL